jgi:hypothetical protein
MPQRGNGGDNRIDGVIQDNNGTAGAISVDPRLTGAAAGWSGFAQMACGAAASQLVGSLQDGWPAAVFWFMAGASLLALLSHLAALRKAEPAG